MYRYLIAGWCQHPLSINPIVIPPPIITTEKQRRVYNSPPFTIQKHYYWLLLLLLLNHKRALKLPRLHTNGYHLNPIYHRVMLPSVCMQGLVQRHRFNWTDSPIFPSTNTYVLLHSPHNGHTFVAIAKPRFYSLMFSCECSTRMQILIYNVEFERREILQ